MNEMQGKNWIPFFTGMTEKRRGKTFSGSSKKNI
jgi:hypothetical protein